MTAGRSRSRTSRVYGVLTLVFVFVVGFLLAVFMDQKIRFENTFRTIFLYPFALSFVITGLVWQWMLNPAFGLQKSIRDLGWESFSFDWIANRKMVVYTLVIAGVWQRTGLVMALMLAGLRGIDDEIWKASRVDGIPKWRTYVSDRHSDDAAGLRHRAGHRRGRHRQDLRPRRRHDRRRPRPLVAVPDDLHLRVHVRRRTCRRGSRPRRCC